MHDTNRWLQTNFYDVLGVPSSASSADISRAYRRRARQSHPDLSSHGDREEFQRVQEAYDTLGSSSTRRRYDEVRTTGLISTRCYPHAEPAQPVEPDVDADDLWIRPYATQVSYARDGFYAGVSVGSTSWTMTWVGLNPWAAAFFGVRPRPPS